MEPLESGVSKVGTITVDIINNLRLVDPEIIELSSSLQTQSDKFVSGIRSLEEKVAEIRELFQKLGELTDREKMRAMNAANELNATNSRGAAGSDALHLKASIQEKSNELEIAKQQLENLKHLESKQMDFLRRLQSAI